MQQDERTLVLKAKGGDREAFGGLWDAFTPKLFGYLINQVHNRQLAEDLLQSTWLKAVGALPRFEVGRAPFGAWLFAIARNECRQHWRKPQDTVPLDPEHHGGLSGDSNDNAILVEEILNLLPEEDRELLRLRYIADLPAGDIGRVLNINAVAVRVRIHRAVARARALLAAQNL